MGGRIQAVDTTLKWRTLPPGTIDALRDTAPSKK
jgi:hypothetical protein